MFCGKKITAGKQQHNHKKGSRRVKIADTGVVDNQKFDFIIDWLKTKTCQEIEYYTHNRLLLRLWLL
jgi:hypothetical protein